MSVAIRPGRDADAAGFIALIRACWSEYPSIIFDLDGEMPELRALASYYAAAGGALWAAEDATGSVVGMIALRPHPEGAEICRLYLASALRGTGLAERLLCTAAGHAGPVPLVLWSDTRFTRAHRFYEKQSFLRSGPIRPLQDISHSLEYGYRRPWHEVAVLDAAGAASAVPRLAALLTEAAAEGAPVSFRPDLTLAAARAYWTRVAGQVARGERMLLAAWSEGALAGTVSLDLATAPDQPHRAAVKKLLVARAHRRHGLARALLVAVEAAARAAGRRLLTLETTEGPAAALYRAAGWVETGRLPQARLTAAGGAADGLLFHRLLAA